MLVHFICLEFRILMTQGTPDFLPCFQLAISATEFAPAPVAQHKSIERFFGAAAAARRDASPAAPDSAAAGLVGDGPAQASERAAGNASAAAPEAQQGRRCSGGRRGASQGTIESLFRRAPDVEAARRSSGDGGGGSGSGELQQRHLLPHQTADAQQAAPGQAGVHPQPDRPVSQQQDVQPVGEQAVSLTASALHLAPVRTAPASAPSLSPTAMAASPFSASPFSGGSACSGSPFGSPFAGCSQQAAAEAADDTFAAEPCARRETDGAAGRQHGASPAARTSSAGSSGSSGLGTRPGRPSGGRARRSPNAAVVDKRRDLFAAACGAAIAEVSGSLSPASSLGGGSPAGGSHAAVLPLARAEISMRTPTDLSDAAASAVEAAAAAYACTAATDAATASAAEAGAATQDAALPQPLPAAFAGKASASSASALTHASAGPSSCGSPPELDPAGTAPPVLSDAAAAPAGGGTAGTVSPALSDAAAGGGNEASDATLLEGIDIAEQRRILQDIAVRQRLDAGRPGKKRGSSSGAGGTKRGKAGVPAGQTQLSGFFPMQ